VTDREDAARERDSEPLGDDRPGRLEGVAVVGLLAVMAGWLLFGALRKSATYDEWAYLAAGVHLLSTGSNELFDDAPAGIKAWIALPVWIVLAPELPETQDRYPWNYGDRFRDRLADPDLALLLARAPIMFLALLLAWYVYRLSRALWGRWAGLLSLGVLVFEPGFLGHGRVAHGDVAMVAMGMGALYFLWKSIQTGHRRWIMVSAIHLALAAETKFVGLALMPMLAAAALAEAVLRPPGFAGLRRGLVPAARFLCISILTYALVVGLIYRSPSEVITGLERVHGHLAVGHAAFLLGETSLTGWWYYYPVVLLLKVSVPVLVGLLLVPAVLVGRRSWNRFAFVAVPAVGWLGLAMLSPVCLGIRHVLFLVAAGIVALGAHVSTRTRGALPTERFGLRGVIVVGLTLCLAARTVVAFPGFISYLNLPAACLARPYELVNDSNFDWGQDLPALAAWLRSRGNPSIRLLYFGKDDPVRFGIRSRHIGPEEEIPGLDPGYLAVSSTYFSLALKLPEVARRFRRAEHLATPGGTILVFRLRDRKDAPSRPGPGRP